MTWRSSALSWNIEIWVYSTTIWQRLANDEFRGRVASFEFTALTLFQSLSTLWAGYAQDVLQYSLIETVRITALVPLLVTLLWGLFVWKVGAVNASKTALEN